MMSASTKPTDKELFRLFHPIAVMSDGYYRLNEAINTLEKSVSQLRHAEKQGDASFIDEMETIMKSTQQCKEEFHPHLQKAFSLIDKSEINVFGCPMFDNAGNVSRRIKLVPASSNSLAGTTQPIKPTPAAPIDRSSSSSKPDECYCEDSMCRGIFNLYAIIKSIDKCLYHLLIQKVENQGVFGTVIVRILTRLRAAGECLDNLKKNYFEYAEAPMAAQYSMTPEELSSFTKGTRCPANQRMIRSVAGLQRALMTLEKSAFDLLLRKFEELEKESLVAAIKKLRVGVDALATLHMDILLNYNLYQNSVMIAKSQERAKNRAQRCNARTRCKARR